MSLRKFRWSKVYESSEEELMALLDARNIKPTQLEASAGAPPATHNASKDSTIWCAEGSAMVHADQNTFSLQPGDALFVPANTECVLDAGISGYTFYTTK